jgi:hypothetical protein
MFKKIQVMVSKFDAWFEREWGWFFTNGNKKARH